MERLTNYRFRDGLEDFGRLAFALGAGRSEDAIERAKSLYGADVAGLVRGAREALATKAAVPPSLVNDSDFDSYSATAAAFMGAVREQFVGAKIGAQRVNFTGSQMTTAVAASAAWVGVGKAKPVARSSFAAVSVDPTKCAGIVVVPSDAFVVARSDVETALANDLINAVVKRLNATFASSDAATVNAPAGIGVGAHAVPATGATYANIVTDIASMIDAADDLNFDLASSSFIGSPRAVARLALDRIASDDGSLAGRPLLTAAGAQGLMLVDGSRVALASSDTVALSRSEGATIEMSDDPESDTGTVVSLFQKNLVALRAEVFANWTTIPRGEASSADPVVITLTGATWV